MKTPAEQIAALRTALEEIKTVVNPILAREFSQEKLIHQIADKALAATAEEVQPPSPGEKR